MRSLVVALMVLSSLAAGAVSAAADEPSGRYTVRACPAAPSKGDEQRGGWFSATFPDGAAMEPALRPCGSDGVFGLDMTNRAIASASGAVWSFLAPDPLRIDRVRFERRIRVSEGFNYSLQTALAGQAEFTSPYSTSFPAPPTEWTQGTFEMYGGQWLVFMLGCVDTAACSSAQTQSVAVRGFEADLVDPSAPTFQYGIETDQPPPARPTTLAITADAADTGSGVKTTTILLDGAVIGRSTADGTCAAVPYTVPGPCPLTSHVSAPIARDMLERGTGQLEIEAVDAAGNRTRTAPVPLWKFGYTAPTTTPTPRGVLTFAFKSTTKTKINSRYESPPTITGTVRDPGGGAMPGVHVRLDTRLLVRGATFAPLDTVETDKNGAFSLRLPRGPSREIQATALTGDAASVALLRMSVAAPVRLTSNRRTTRNRRSITFTGSVPGTPKDARTRVDLQALGGGGRWLTFASPTLKNGKFRATYRFTRTFSAATYRFRALLRSDPAFPYAAGKSREVRVRVRP